MADTRRFRRVPFSAPCSMEYDGETFSGRLHDISTNGAMIRFNDSVMVAEAEQCRFHILLEDRPALHLVVEVVYSSYFSMGVKFVDQDEETRQRLNELVETLIASTEPPPPEVSGT